MIAAPVQCDVDGIPKGSHYVSLPPIKVRLGSLLIDGHGRPVVPDAHGPDRLAVDDHPAIVRREVALLVVRASGLVQDKPAWGDDVFKIWSRRPDSNRRPAVYKSGFKPSVWCRRVLASAVLYSAAANFVPISINRC